LVVAAILSAGVSITFLDPSASAATSPSALYVSATAQTNPTCALASKKHPFATIAGALACAGAGQQIKIGKGTFAGAFSVTGNVTITGSR
jgi:hypothetical protein